MEGIYKVNLIPSDLSTEETILQIADTLDNLNGIVDDVFARLMSRISRNMDKTNKLTERIELSRGKVETLSGMQKAIKVFSGAKYPASITHEHYQSIFGLDGYQHEPLKVNLSGKTQGQSNDKGVQEKLHFYHVKVAQPKSPKPKKDFNLEAIIGGVSTVGELLVFNTDESPYFSTESRVASVAAYVPKVAESADSKGLLEAAPSSILNRDVLKREADEYMYAPGMGMVPELEMPLDLPHLPGVAGDVQYSITSDGSIAPSVVTSPVTPPAAMPDPDLPDIPDLPLVQLPDVAELPDITEASPAPAPSAFAPPPPPPPPPPPSAPPPPPQPPMPVETSITDGQRHEKAPRAPPAAAGDAHSNLMAAIRQAGGAGRAKLRPAADSTPGQDPKASSGDLMADLHAKLSMRRRGISGAERARGTVLHTLASVIPEPGEQSTPQRSSSEDEWE